ncbi:MAG TPA: hypothetical protein VNN07_02130 [Candidatus Tectomicrobia bacterium]|nr:hypothetical protein [Candidatus Tectomicrobia bacterium]
MKLTEKLSRVTNQIAGWKAALATLRDEERRLRTEHADALKERERVASAPLPLDEVIARMRRFVDEAAAAWRTEWARVYINALGNPARRPDLPDACLVRGAFSLREQMLMDPEHAKAVLEAILRSAPYEAGPPEAERPALLAALDARIAALEREHTELVDLARAQDPPIILDLLPVVKERREAEARQREHAERRAEHQRQVKAWESGTVVRASGRSQYIQSAQRERAELRQQ